MDSLKSCSVRAWPQLPLAEIIAKQSLLWLIFNVLTNLKSVYHLNNLAVQSPRSGRSRSVLYSRCRKVHNESHLQIQRRKCLNVDLVILKGNPMQQGPNLFKFLLYFILFTLSLKKLVLKKKLTSNSGRFSRCNSVPCISHKMSLKAINIRVNVCSTIIQIAVIPPCWIQLNEINSKTFRYCQ